MKKTTICTIVNLLLLIVVWGGGIVFFRQIFGWNAIWKLGLVAVVGLPIAGYFVQFFLSPVVNRLIGGKLPK